MKLQKKVILTVISLQVTSYFLILAIIYGEDGKYFASS